MSDNESVIADEQGEYPDWIELYNKSKMPVQLKNYGLSDKKSDRHKWKFPDVTIPGKGYLLVFASGKDTAFANEIHTNFRIDSDGEFLSISDNKGKIIDVIDPLKLTEDHSYGRFPDGSPLLMRLTSPTPGATNETTDHLIFSHEAGFFKKPVQLKITSLLGDTVYYTTNGDDPAPSSNLYSKPVKLGYRSDDTNYFSTIPTTIDQQYLGYKTFEPPKTNIHKVNIIKCASFRNGERSSKIYCKTFFIDSLISKRYTFPVLSIVTEEENFFSYQKGIYVPGINLDSNNILWSGNYHRRGMEWERPVDVEYFSASGELLFSQKAGVRIHGGGTRAAAQKSLRLYARKEYGEKYFNHRILPDRDVGKYKRILLRSTMGDWFNTQTMLKDVAANEIVENLDFEYQDHQPVIVYLNGEYWGIHAARDRIDTRYISYLYGVDKDSVDLIYNGYGIPISGSNEDFVKMLDFIDDNDLADNDNYNYVKSKIDINCYIDYMIAETFFINLDWPVGNQKIWKSQNEGSKWRWIFYDLDGGLYPLEKNMFEHATMNDSSITWPNPPQSTFLFRNLLKNKDFVDRFIDRYAELLKSNFDRKNMERKILELKDMYRVEIVEHSIRWNYPESKELWERNVDEFIIDFLKERPCIIENQIMEFFDFDNFAFSCADTIDAIYRNDKLVLYPNPGNGLFYLFNKTPDELNGNLIVTDLIGKKVFELSNIDLKRFDIITLDLQFLKPDFYIFTFFNKKFREQKKIIVFR